ncbi:uncharacterized [Tachysurus ichikawai]
MSSSSEGEEGQSDSCEDVLCLGKTYRRFTGPSLAALNSCDPGRERGGAVFQRKEPQFLAGHWTGCVMSRRERAADWSVTPANAACRPAVAQVAQRQAT